MFSLCVVTTISLVGMVWYQSFQTKLYVLMDRQPPQSEEAPAYAANSNNSAANSSAPSLFASLSGVVGNVKAMALDLFHVFDNKNNNTDGEIINGKPHVLPLSGDK